VIWSCPLHIAGRIDFIVMTLGGSQLGQYWSRRDWTLSAWLGAGVLWKAPRDACRSRKYLFEPLIPCKESELWRASIVRRLTILPRFSPPQTNCGTTHSTGTSTSKN